MSEIKTTGPAGCAAFVLLAPVTVWNGLLFSKIWGWFAVPTFHAPALGVPQSIGLLVIASWLKGYNSKNSEWKSADSTDQIFELLSPSIYSTLAFAIGYFAHLYA